MFLLVGKGEIFGYNQVCLNGSALFTKRGRKKVAQTARGKVSSGLFRVTDFARAQRLV